VVVRRLSLERRGLASRSASLLVRPLGPRPQARELVAQATELGVLLIEGSSGLVQRAYHGSIVLCLRPRQPSQSPRGCAL
jgi:hypothetical protein